MPQKNIIPLSTTRAVNKIQARINEKNGDAPEHVQGLIEALALIMAALVEDGEQ